MGNKQIKKVLIANRGEIAVRVNRACQELGIATVAVYSDVDRLGLHVRLADEAYCLGPAPSGESYLVQEKLLAILEKSGADAVHPGYGFLAENPEFAQKVIGAGLAFLGPSPEAMRLMGDKTAARKCMQKANVPVVPGTEETLEDDQAVASIATELGYPILLKAAAGGGGKGMRVVQVESEIPSAFRAARSEAEKAFGDGRVYIEKYLESPRHIEFQILADKHGNVVHLGERECSIQRRHQKVIEEAPSCILDDELRRQMGQAAVDAARACHYENAGTIEFMLDKERSFYFLEMNTRLQVEHPVTEEVTDIDIVKEQIRIAEGKPLGFKQEDIHFRGHAIECRIYAEDPANNFLPSTGTIDFMTPPSGPGVRDDNGYYSGAEVSVYYDPLIAKLIVRGNDRDEAIARMKRALREYQLSGVETSIPFCLKVLEHERFVEGDFDTHFVEEEFLSHPKKFLQEGVQSNNQEIAAIAAVLYHHMQSAKSPAPKAANSAPATSGWKAMGRLNKR